MKNLSRLIMGICVGSMMLAGIAGAKDMTQSQAAAPEGAYDIALIPEGVGEASVEATPRGAVLTASMNLAKTGAYDKLSGFGGEYAKGTEMTFSGTWQPSYGAMEIRVMNATGGNVMFTLSSGERHAIDLWMDSTWTVEAKALDTPVIGTIQLATRN